MKQIQSPFVSIVVPAFNSGHFIRFALDGVLNQTYPSERIEIIVVDDGSTDNTARILTGYTGRIIHVYQQHKGIAGARNKGVLMAGGEIITFLDADDVWHEERIERVVDAFMRRPDIGMVYHPVELIDGEGRTIHENFYRVFGYKEGISGWVAMEIFSGHIFCGGSSFAFKREIMDKVYPIPEDIRRGIDYYMSAILSCHAAVEYIPEILGKYRSHGGNITMLAGQDDYKELAAVNRDFALMRQRVIESISSIKNKTLDLTILRRIQAKEVIFYNILSGKRIKGIKHLPLLFMGRPSLNAFLRGAVISSAAFFIPSVFYPVLMKIYELLKRLKLIRF